MDLIHPAVDGYLARLCASRDPVLVEMERLADQRGFPIVGPQVGRLLYVLTLAAGARRVIELGSGFGYSAYWFAHAVGPAGSVVLTEGSSARAAEARQFLDRAGLGARVRIEVGDALQIAARYDPPFDVVFNDIDKHDYPRVPSLAARLLRPAGVLISDNMLWHGHVLRDLQDDATRGVKELTTRLFDPTQEFFSALVPIRDGVVVAVRNPADGERPDAE